MPVPSEEFEPTSSANSYFGHGHGLGSAFHGPSSGLQFNYAYAAPRQQGVIPGYDGLQNSYHHPAVHRYSPELSPQVGHEMGMQVPPMMWESSNGMFNVRDQFLSPATVPKPSLGIGMHLGLETASEMFDRFDKASPFYCAVLISRIDSVFKWVGSEWVSAGGGADGMR
eukprot:3477436-Rhodomonas_salina.3